jgi:hypothetical protein
MYVPNFIGVVSFVLQLGLIALFPAKQVPVTDPYQPSSSESSMSMTAVPQDDIELQTA